MLICDNAACADAARFRILVPPRRKVQADRPLVYAMFKRPAGESTLFESFGLAGNVVNLKVGAPGEDELKKCVGILQKATATRLVRNLYLT